MNICMLSTRMGCEDGHVVHLFCRGQIYDVADTQARAFILSGWATEAEQDFLEHNDT